MLILSVVAFTLIACGNHNRKHGQKISEATRLEIPVKIANRNGHILMHINYTVSYNAEWKIANWVAYQLTIICQDICRRDIFKSRTGGERLVGIHTCLSLLGRSCFYSELITYDRVGALENSGAES
jgi:hypothetical protein